MTDNSLFENPSETADHGTSSLFDEGTNTPSAPAPVDQDKDYLSELVGEGKKFKTVQDLARGKAESDAFIEHLKDEQKRLREERNSLSSLQDLVEKMRSGAVNAERPNGNENTDSGNDFYTGGQADPNENRTPANTAGMTEEQIQALIEDRISRDKEENNLQQVRATLKQKLGENYGPKLQEKAQELGMSLKELDNYARRNPKAFYRLVELDKQPDSSRVSPPQSQVNSEAFSVRGEPFSKYSDFEKLRQENPNLYWSPKVQNQIFKLTKEKGEDFLRS